MAIQKLSKFWPSMTNNPNVPDNEGKTPSSVADNAKQFEESLIKSFNTSRPGPCTSEL